MRKKTAVSKPKYVKSKTTTKYKVAKATKSKAKTQTKVKNYGSQGTGQPLSVYSHGRRSLLNPKFVQTIRQALTSVDTQQFLATAYRLSSIGECSYMASPIIKNTAHMLEIASHMTSGTPITKKFTVQNATLSTSVTNQSSGVCNLRIYECVFRHDIPWMGALADPLQVLTQGFIDAGLPSAIDNISSTAFRSPTFVTWFKILKTSQIELNAGETKNFVLKDQTPQFINVERLNPGGLGYAILGYGNKSRFFLFQQWGQVVNDETITSQISTDKTKLDFVHTTRYSYTFMDDYTNNVYTSGTLGTVNTAQYISEQTGTVIQDTQA